MLLLNSILYFHVFTYVIHANLLPPHPYNTKYLQKCICNIEEKYFKSSDVIIFINLNKLLQELRLNLRAFIRQNYHIENLISFTFIKVNVYVIIGPEDLVIELIKSLIKTTYWNPRAKFVIILDKKPNNLFKVLHKYYVFNGIAVIPKSIYLTKVYTAFPYNYSIDPEERHEPFLIDWCYMGKFQKQEHLFPDKLPNEWDDFTVRVVLMEYPPYVICSNCDDDDKNGIEIRILRLIKSILRFKIRYVKRYFPTWGRLLSNGSYDGAYGHLQNYRADLAIGTFPANYTENWHFDLSFPYLEDTHKWAVPAARKQASWKNILTIFEWTIWILIIVSLFLVSYTLYHLASLLSDLKSYQDYSRCLFICLQCLLGQGINHQPIRFGVRILFILWAFLSWLIAVGFQSHLVTALNFNSYENQISNVKDLINSELKIGFYDLLASLFTSEDSKEDTYIYQNFVSCPLDNACLNRTAFQRDFATIKVNRYLQNMMYKYYLDPTGKPLLYVFKKESFYVLFTMVFSKGFPLYEDINKLLILLKSNGFIEENYKREKYYAEIIEKSQSVGMQADILDIFEVQDIFSLLFLGWLLSITVFIAEHALKPEMFLK